MICPNQPLVCDAYSPVLINRRTFHVINLPARKMRPSTFQSLRFSSDVRTNAPFRVPTNNRTLLIAFHVDEFEPFRK